MDNNTSQFKKDALEKATQLSTEEILEAIGELQALVSEREKAQSYPGETGGKTMADLGRVFKSHGFASEHTDTAENADKILRERFGSTLDRKRKNDAQ